MLRTRMLDGVADRYNLCREDCDYTDICEFLKTLDRFAKKLMTGKAVRVKNVKKT